MIDYKINFSFYRLTNTATGESRDILHFHYTAWADFDVPQCDTFLEYLNAVRQSKSLEDGVGPPIVHCSAGKKINHDLQYAKLVICSMCFSINPI